MRKLTSIGFICLAVSACAVSRVDNLSVPLAYSPNPKGVGLLGGLTCNGYAQLTVTDARVDKTLGLRTHESKPLKAEVTTSSDVPAWVRDGVQNFLQQNGVTQGKGPSVRLAVDSLRTTESIWHRSSYEANIALTGQLQSASGKTCFKSTVQGTGGNYGYSGSVENYQQTLNQALDDATKHLAQQEGFRDALCSCIN